MFACISTLEQTVAPDHATETSYSPSQVNEALAIAYGYNSTEPTRHHLLALIEHFGTKESVEPKELF